MIKAFIFDVGEVLVNKSPVLDEIVKEFNLKEDIIKDYYRKILDRYQLGKIHANTFWRLFRKKFQITKPIPRPSPLIRRYQNEIKINQRVLKIATSLKKKGYLLAIISNTIPDHAKHLRKLGLFKNFDTVVLSYNVHLLKPQSAIYQLTLRKLKVKPREAVFIDNKVENVKGAEKLGIKGIIFTGANNLKKDLKKLDILI